MKKTLALAAVAAFGLAGAANADVTVDFEDFVQPGGSVAMLFDVGELTGDLTGITGDFELYQDAENFTWASDLMVLGVDGNDLANDDYILQAGGFSDFGAANSYDWQGTDGDSSDAGAFVNETIDIDPSINVDGLSIWLGNGYGSGGNGYWEGSITLHGVEVVPAPGALALLGVAGVVGARRRRRA